MVSVGSARPRCRQIVTGAEVTNRGTLPGSARDGGGRRPPSGVVSGRAVALIDPTPAYRRGLAVALEEAGFSPQEPAQLRDWVRSVVGPLIVVTVRGDADWEAVCPEVLGSQVPVVALLPSPTPEAYAAALDRGATGVAPWEAAPEEIVRVLHAAADGLAALPLDVARSLARQGCPNTPPEWMTTTAVECLRSLANGTTVGAMARRTGCSERAMYRRLQSLYGRMGVTNRSEAILQASRWGLV